MGQALNQLKARVDEVEHNLTSHRHQFASKQIHTCGLATMHSASSPMATLHCSLPQEDLTPSTHASGTTISWGGSSPVRSRSVSHGWHRTRSYENPPELTVRLQKPSDQTF